MKKMEWGKYLNLYGMGGQEREGDSVKKAGEALAQAGERSRAGRKLVDLQA